MSPFLDQQEEFQNELVILQDVRKFVGLEIEENSGEESTNGSSLRDEPANDENSENGSANEQGQAAPEPLV